MDKFTIRDFLVFFTTGLIGLILFSLLHLKELNEIVIEEFDRINKTHSLIIFGTVPVIYFLGHLFQAIEDVFYLIGNYFRRFSDKFRIFKPINFLINGHRVQKVLERNSVEPRDFWQMCSKIQLKKVFGHAEYWYVMSDFFKSIFAITICLILYSVWWCDIKITLLYFVIGVLTWYRSRVFSNYFVRTVLDTDMVIKKSNEDDEK